MGGMDDGAVERKLARDGVEPAVQVAEIVADLEGTEADQLRSTYETIGDVLDHVFDRPPSPEAAVEVSFTYEGYRVTVDQDGAARFAETA